MVMPRSFLLLEPVGVDVGEGLDEAGLAVVDMTGGAEDDLFHVVGTSSHRAAAISGISRSATVRRSSSS